MKTKPIKASELAAVEVQLLQETFPDLCWMEPSDWQAVAAFADWDRWFDEADGWKGEREATLRRLLSDRAIRIELRTDCRKYFGELNVTNILDPTDETWA